MDIDARIRRRRRRETSEPLVHDYRVLAPVTHVPEPTDRGPFLERLLDLLEPVFDGELPTNAYVWGPQGAGKSAVLAALFEHLRGLPRQTESIIYTTTRAQDRAIPGFVTVDAREAASEFGLYRAILDGLAEESVPRHGVGTERLRERLGDRLSGRSGRAVVLVDHVDEPATLGRRDLLDALAPYEDSIRWLCVGRDPPGDAGWGEVAEEVIEVAPYREQVLVDVLMERASQGLARRSFDHAHARTIAEWADGSAHDALAALFVAADAAATAGRDRVTAADVEVGTDDVPRPCVALGRVLALPPNRQAVLRVLVGLDDDERSSVSTTTDAIVDHPRIDLSRGTVKRFLYELAESGVLERVENVRADGQGRPPSRVAPRFPPTLFERFYDLRER